MMKSNRAKAVSTESIHIFNSIHEYVVLGLNHSEPTETQTHNAIKQEVNITIFRSTLSTKAKWRRIRDLLHKVFTSLRELMVFSVLLKCTYKQVIADLVLK